LVLARTEILERKANPRAKIFTGAKTTTRGKTDLGTGKRNGELEFAAGERLGTGNELNQKTEDRI
jgi:hypothetical protein